MPQPVCNVLLRCVAGNSSYLGLSDVYDFVHSIAPAYSTTSLRANHCELDRGSCGTERSTGFHTQVRLRWEVPVPYGRLSLSTAREVAPTRRQSKRRPGNRFPPETFGKSEAVQETLKRIVAHIHRGSHHLCTRGACDAVEKTSPTVSRKSAFRTGFVIKESASGRGKHRHVGLISVRRATPSGRPRNERC